MSGPQTKQQIQALLAAAGARPRRQFGQNFMIDRNLVRIVADAAALAPGDLVLEIGPGTGTLTAELLDRGAQVLAVEIDRHLAAALRQSLGDVDRFRLIEGDALAGKHALHPDLAEAIAQARSAGWTVKLAANLPYNIASPLLVELLLAGVDLLACTIQREVAGRLRARPGTESYGALSVVIQLLADVEVLRHLPPAAFWPAPGVESSLVVLRRRDRLGPHARAFADFVHQLFAQRRKMLRHSLAGIGAEAVRAAAELGIATDGRAEQLAPEVTWELFTRMRSTQLPRGVVASGAD